LSLRIVAAGLLIGNHGRTFAMSETTRKNLNTFWELIDEILSPKQRRLKAHLQFYQHSLKEDKIVQHKIPYCPKRLAEYMPPTGYIDD
jgi:hypothetical protein